MADRSVSVRLKGDISDFNRAMLAASAGTKAFTQSLDTSTNRMGNLVQTSLALGPALVPIGAAAIPAISGLTNQLAFAAAGAGVAALAFAGVGDALGALNDYQLEPTAANFRKMQDALATLGPAGQDFVRFLQTLRPEMQEIQNIAQAGLFPGLEAGLDDLMKRAPQVERIVSEIASTMGDLIAEAGDNLASSRWNDFFDFLENEARPTLEDMGRSLGNFAEGFANLWMAFQPMSSDFSTSFLQMSRDFAEWTDGLSATEGFQDFLDYVSRVGPKAWDALGAIGNALIQLLTAAAPVGEVVLPVIEAMADVFASIAGSPIGPILIGVAAGLSAVSRAIALYNVANGSALAGLLTKVGGNGAGFRAAGAAAGIFALSLTDLDEKMGLTNTATYAMAGAIAGPWGAAVGAGVGLAKDLAASTDGLSNAMAAVDAAAQSGNIERFSAAVAALRGEVHEASGAQANFGQKVANAGESLKAQGGSLGVLGGLIDQFTTSNVEAGGAANASAAELQAQAFAEYGLAGAMQGTTQATRDQTYALIENTREALNNANEKSAQINSEIAYERAIDAATETIKRNGANTNIATKAGQENVSMIRNWIDRWNAMTPAAQAARGGIDRARKAFIDSAVAAGYSRDEAKKLARELIDLDKLNPKVDVKVNTDAAYAAVNAFRSWASHLPIIGMKFSASQARASGGYISGPGGPRDDAIPAWLSNGEYVVNAAATRQFRPLLEQINARGFANGGQVLRPPAPTGALSSGGGISAGPTVTQYVYPQPQQSEQEIGRHAADRFLWALDIS